MSERLEVEILATIDGFEKSLNAAQAKLEKFGQAATKLGTALSAALTLPIVGLGAASIKAFGDIQALKNGLTAVTGSADAAATQFVRLQKIAKLPGLGLEEAVRGSINLQTIGFSADKAEKSMQAFGNAVATVGKGRAEFERAIYGLQQLANTDFPLGEDLNIIKDAIPQVTPLLKEAFGTARSDDLQKLGVTSAQVVDTIITGLNKLPSVTGGINGAFENLSDGVKSNLAKVGESINNAFDISAIIDSFVASLGGIVDAFTSLSPQTQKVIITIAGFLAALGPVILAVGVFSTTVIPALTAGLTVLGTAFAAITGPIGLIAVGIGAAVYLIIKYWDDVVAYFTTGDGKGVFDTLVETFNSAVTFIKEVWSEFTKYLSDFWNKWGSTITFIAKNLFSNLASIFKIAFSIIGGIFRAGTAILTGDWAGLGTILIDTTKKIFNGITNIIVNTLRVAGGLISKLFEALGGTGFADKLNSFLTSVQNKISFDIPIKLDTKKEFVTSINEVGKGVEEVTKKVVALGAATKQAKKEFEDIAHVGSAGVTQTTGAELSVPPLTLNPRTLEALPQLQSDLNKNFQDITKTILSNGITDAFTLLGSSIGNALAGGSNILQTLGAGLLGIIGNMATQLGKAAIGIGAAMIGIKNAFKNPLTAIAAGVALVAIGAFISSKVATMTKGDNQAARSAPIPQFANGGIISGPTVGLMGEYAGAKNNPEVVAPLNKLKGMLGQDNNGSLIPEIKLRGEDIYVAFKRTSKRMGGLT